jgi:pantetheine-phosphate adenylyltransferase
LKICICPGSFDPITNGHVDIIERAAKMFDKVIVAVLINKSKVPVFTLEERILFLKKVFKGRPNIEIDSFSGQLWL